jgi:hypothetical protein
MVSLRSLSGLCLLGSSALGIVAFLAEGQAIATHPAAWRAWTIPAVIAVAGIFAGYRLLRSSSGWILAFMILGAQTVALSLGPIAYRLIVGPFLSVRIDGTRGVTGGVDARFLFIAGSGNQVPTGVALNLIPCAMLVLLELAWRSQSDRETARRAIVTSDSERRRSP